MTARSESRDASVLALLMRNGVYESTAWRMVDEIVAWFDGMGTGLAEAMLPNLHAEMADSRERAIRWAVTLEGQLAQIQKLVDESGPRRMADGEMSYFMLSREDVVAALTGSTEDAATDQCKNGHPFEPGVDIDMVREGRSPSPLWCNVCGASR